MVLIKEFIDNQDNLNAIERLNSQDQVLLNVNNLGNNFTNKNLIRLVYKLNINFRKQAK